MLMLNKIFTYIVEYYYKSYHSFPLKPKIKSPPFTQPQPYTNAVETQ